jgi:hypothetical protein
VNGGSFGTGKSSGNVSEGRQTFVPSGHQDRTAQEERPLDEEIEECLVGPSRGSPEQSVVGISCLSCVEVLRRLGYRAAVAGL